MEVIFCHRGYNTNAQVILTVIDLRVGGMVPTVDMFKRSCAIETDTTALRVTPGKWSTFLDEYVLNIWRCFLLSHVHNERKYYNRKNIRIEILIGLQVWAPLNTKSNFFLILSVFVFLWTSLAFERLDGFFLYSIFKSSFIIGLSPVKMIILALEASKHNRNFLENGFSVVD
jgi:hypothetical protein